jgi:alpha-beta hydrolase superfamily lysophospholipase
MSAHVEHTEEFFLEVADGTTLFVRDWSAKSNKAPGILIMHGLGEHSGRYIHIARFFLGLGFRVRSFDQRGHGQSSGRRGVVPDDEAILRDTRLVINDFLKQLPDAPMIFAHSMGGLFATHFVLQGLAPVKAFILSSPAFSVKTSTFQKILFKFSRALIPYLGVAHGTNGRYLSHDSEVVAAYQNDPLVHSRISASLFGSMLSSMSYVKAHIQELPIPLLLLVADADVVVNPRGAKALVQQIENSEHAKFLNAIFYPGFYHEIFNELEALRSFDDVRTWLEQKNLMPETPAISAT